MIAALNALVIENLVKRYDNGFEALKGCNLTVEAGDFFALLGPNGAGKSTAIGIISSLVRPTSGRVSVFGADVVNEPEAAKRMIGLVPQEINFNQFEPILEILINVGGYNGIRRPEARERAEHYLNQLSLWDKRRSSARELSGGMKRRLMIARALIHDPGLLILDEPTAGVDIEIRRSMWDFLRKMNADNGTTIILTTHYLEEAEALCRNVAIIDQGLIVEQGRVSSLLSRSMVETFVLDLAAPPKSRPELGDIVINDLTGDRLEVEVPRGTNLTELFATLERQSITVTSLRNKSNRLEEFFLRLVKQK